MKKIGAIPAGTDLILLDCIGDTVEMKEEIKVRAGKQAHDSAADPCGPYDL